MLPTQIYPELEVVIIVNEWVNEWVTSSEIFEAADAGLLTLPRSRSYDVLNSNRQKSTTLKSFGAIEIEQESVTTRKSRSRHKSQSPLSLSLSLCLSVSVSVSILHYLDVCMMVQNQPLFLLFALSLSLFLSLSQCCILNLWSSCCMFGGFNFC